MIARRALARMYDLRDSAKTSTRLIVGLLVILATALAWFGTIHGGILMGDDLGLVDAFQHGQFATSILDALTTTADEKYRPVLNLALGVELHAFGTVFAAYEALNIAIEVVSATLVGAIVLRLARGNGFLALMCSLAFIISRFAYYNVMQVLGIMEALALLLMLLAVRDAADAFVLGRYGRLTRMVGWYLLAVFTDERYIVMGLFVVACVVVHPQTRSNVKSAAVVAGGAVAVLMLFVLSRALLHEHMLVGTGGRVVLFNPLQWNAFFWSGVANLLGFNIGPDYLSAKDLSGTGVTGYVLGLAVAVPAIGLFAFWLIEVFRRRRYDDLRYAAVALSLLVPLLLSASVTFRQEFRWLYAADTIFLIGLVSVAVRIEPRRLGVGAAMFACAASITGAVWYRSYIDNVYLFSAMDIAYGVRDAVQHDAASTAFVVDNGDHAYPDWVFADQRFFVIYGIIRPTVNFVDTVTDVHDPAADIFAIRGATVVQLERQAAPVRPFANTTFSFTKSFRKGTLNSNAPVSTPTHRGALVFSWPGPSGPVPSLTVVQPFRYSYPPQRIAHGTTLRFYLARPYPVGSPTRALVTVTDGGKSTVVFDETVPLASPTKLLWTPRDVDLSRFAPHAVVLTFGAIATSDPTAAWVAFGYPSLVTGRR